MFGLTKINVYSLKFRSNTLTFVNLNVFYK